MLYLLKYLILVLVNSAVSSTTFAQTSKCGYDTCLPIKKGSINVHMVPHSHDDVGWQKTVEEYYYGLNDNIQRAGVQYIIGSVVEALQTDPTRRFIQVETVFFWKWYNIQTEKTKKIVKDHVRNGKLEFIGGGWSMNDEATTHYQSIIDQFTWGLKKLNDTFGECGRPKIGWQIDPFGHSREMAAIFAQMGYDAFILARTDFQERNMRQNDKTNQMIWRSNPTLGSNYDIFTSILYNDGYSSPPFFCFDELCRDSPIIDDPTSSNNNVDHMVDLFMTEIAKRVAVSPTNHIIIPMGGDFTMQNAHKTFLNLDKLIHYVNLRQINGSQYHLLYSTPSCYAKAIYDTTKGKRGFPLKTDDFLPYGTGPKAYWTGYYTSRPTLKRNEREGNNMLQITKQLQTLSFLKDDKRIDDLRSAMGVLQHHDAITGTEKQAVTDDYTRMLFKAIENSEKVVSNALNKLVKSDASTVHSTCHLANISQCSLTEEQKVFIVTVYNPLSREVDKYVRLPVTGTNYSVKNPVGTSIQVQILPIVDQILNIPGRESKAIFDLVFLAEDIPPLGFKSFYIEETEGDISTAKSDVSQLAFQAIQITIDPDTGLLNSIHFDGIKLPVTQDIQEYYGAYSFTNQDEVRNSGAYAFTPREPAHKIWDKKLNFTVYKGELVHEIHQTFGDYASQIIRVYSKEKFVEFDWLVGPMPVMDVGRELVSVFQTDLNTNLTFYTETNGKQLMKRIKDYRPSYNFTVPHSIAANYYPINSRIILRDEVKNVEFAVINDRPQGGTSLEDGKVELMIHRACAADDGLGVNEVLREEAYGKPLVVRGSHYVVAGLKTESSRLEKDIVQRKVLDAWSFISTTNKSFEEYKTAHKMEFSGLNSSLPKNIQILTLEPWRNSTKQFLLRLEHIFDKEDDEQLGQPVIVDLKNLFSTFKITNMKETTLAANQWLEKSLRLKFDASDIDFIKDKEDPDQNSEKTVIDDLDNLVLGLRPTEIRTVMVTAKRK